MLGPNEKPSWSKHHWSRHQQRISDEWYEKQKIAFEECKRQLEQAKKDLEDLQAKQKEMEEQTS